jgi:hypothetical protein
VLDGGTDSFILIGLHIPTNKKDFLSSAHLDMDLEYIVLYKKGECQILSKDNQIIGKGKLDMRCGLYILNQLILIFLYH